MSDRASSSQRDTSGISRLPTPAVSGASNNSATSPSTTTTTSADSQYPDCSNWSSILRDLRKIDSSNLPHILVRPSAILLNLLHLKVLIKYLDTDYAETKKTLYPLLESNMITFDLLWALFKPNTIAYTTTYGHTDEPRAFKIEYATKESSFMKGSWVYREVPRAYPAGPSAVTVTEVS